MSPTLASQVAAGEVVERPASVVKELVENSLDAGAKFVRVEIRRGGVGMIKVTDDGSGMSRADAELCTKRHATSKLSSLEELFEITHLGFRGEALPSIASVSRFKLCTRQQQDLEGWEIRIDGGLEHEPRSSGVSPGTAIEVADLFYNTPARRKFLKSAETEASHVEHQIRLHALAYPQVRFAYKRDDQLVFDLPATADLRVRISALTDAATAAALIPIETTIGPGISITGFLLPLSEARRTRKGQYVFMNTRPVEDQLINRAIRDGYGGFPTGLHPALFLYMEVEPALVDVNVHPAKKEVRFRRSADVVNTIVEAIANTLQKHARQEIHAAAAPEPLPDSPTFAYTLPLEGGKVLNPYSGGQLVKNKTLNVWRTHDAVDIQGEKGARVYAIGDGVVASVTNDALWGGVVQIDHPDGRSSVYSGLVTGERIKAGTEVLAGEELGTLGDIPAEISAEPHLHLALTKEGKAVDPAEVLTFQ